jgi:hypothetical protein
MKNKLTNIFFIFVTVSISIILLLFSISFYFKNIYNSEVTSKGKEESFKIDSEMKILVLNSTNVAGIAKEMKLFLNTFEFKGVDVGNDSSNYENSRILIKSNRVTQGNFIAKIIHINEHLVEQSRALDSSDIDCVVILGKDYKLLKPFQK